MKQNVVSKTDVVDIAFGFDANYVAHAAAVIASVSRYGKASRFRFILLHEGVSREQQAKVEALAPNGRFVWIEVGEKDVPQFEARRHLTRSTLYRLGLEKLAPADCRRVLYLDSDITVIGDVTELWRTDLKGAALGAVVDGFLAYNYADGPPFYERWGLPPGKYFNAGILLIDLEKVRRDGLFSKAMAFVAQHDFGLPFDDQDALNHTFWNAYCPLSIAWNLQRPHAVWWEAPTLPDKLGAERAMIIHYTGPEKPWLSTGYHPWAWTYWQSLSHTPFLAQVARAQGVSRVKRLKLLVRWLKRRPVQAVLVGHTPVAALR